MVISLRVLFVLISLLPLATLLTAQTDDLQVISFSPVSLPPGGELTIKGSGFSSEPGRTRILVKAGDAFTIPVSPLDATTDTLKVFVVPLLIGTQRDWYKGSVQVCVQMGEKEVCAADQLNIEPPAIPALPLGETLLTMADDLAISVSDSIEDPGLSQIIRTDSQTNIANLRAIITEARAGNPRSTTFTNIDGSIQTALFDVSLLQNIESLLVAYKNTTTTASTSQQKLSFKAATSDRQSCSSSAEKALMLASAKHRSLVQLQTLLTYVSLAAALTAAVAICVSSGPACLVVAAPATVSILSTLGTAFTLVSWPLFIQQIMLEHEANYLAEIYPSETAFNLQLFTSRSFTVLGRFVGLSAETEFKSVVLKAISDSLFTVLPVDSLKFPAVADLLTQIAGGLAQQALDNWIGTHVPSLPGSVSRIVQLGADSVSLDYWEQPSDMAITLACGNSMTSTVFAQQNNNILSSVFLKPTGPFLLLPQQQRPQGWFQTWVVADPTVTLQLITTPIGVIGGKDTRGVLSLSHPLPGDVAVRLTVPNFSTDPIALLSYPSQVVIRAGTVSADFIINTRPVSVPQFFQISATYGFIARPDGNHWPNQVFGDVRLFPPQ